MRNPVTLWVLGDVRCTFELLAEGCFELRVTGPDGDIAREYRCDSASLLALADRMRADLAFVPGLPQESSA
jgi:hypothetical protein